MSVRIYFGEIQELILLMVARVRADAYRVSITEELEGQTDCVFTIRAVHNVPYKLDEKEFMKPKIGGASTERGVRRNSLFQITADGRQTLEELRGVCNRTWAQIPNI